MLSYVTDKISTFLTEGHERTLKAKKHILISIFLKIINAGCGFLMVPLAISYLGMTTYGIWVVLFGFLTWMAFFDLGLGHGLRNKFAEAKASGNDLLARSYVSTAYAIITFVTLGMLVLVFGIVPLINWIAIFNAPVELSDEVKTVVLLVFAYFSISFFLKLIYMIFKADQKPSYWRFYELLVNISVLITVFVLSKTTNGSLIYMGLAISCAPFLILLFSNFYHFNSDYKNYSPKLQLVDFKHTKDLMGLGLQFFIIQLSMMMMVTLDNIIITNLFTPDDVVPYDVAFKYFQIPLIFFFIITEPFWSAYTEAYVKREFSWVKSTHRNLLKIWMIMFVGGIGMVLFADTFYNILFYFTPEDRVEIPFMLSVGMFLYVMIHSLGHMHVSFINGISKIKLQLYVSVFTAALNIPLSIYLARDLGLGSVGVILATAIVLAIYYGIMIIQFQLLIKDKAKGIWNI